MDQSSPRSREVVDHRSPGVGGPMSPGPRTAVSRSRGSPPRWWRAVGPLLVLLALPLVVGCGLPAGGPVEEVAVPTTRPDAADPLLPRGWREVSVYFVSGSNLEEVPRRVAERGPQVVMGSLLAGPTQAEVVSGLRTALPPLDLQVMSGPDDSGIVTVAVGREFAGIAGGNQLLAVAQVVWTVTQFVQVDRVCFTLDGSFVEVPTDTGLTDQPVGRTDFMSVAPLPDEATGAPIGTSPAARSDG